jgi:hypothetical protein
MLSALLCTVVLATAQTPVDLPVGPAPAPLAIPHFPDRLRAFVWRNWSLIPAARMAEVVGARTKDVLWLGESMGLPNPPRITEERMQRSYLTVIRRNWHLLPYDQLLKLLGWTPEKMAYTLREDDFLFVKLGNLKPKCDPLLYSPPNESTRKREVDIARIVRSEFPGGLAEGPDPLFGFVKTLSRPTTQRRNHPATQPRFCYSYFALYGDPLLDPKLDPYPDGLLSRLAARGVNGVWLQGVLYKLAPFPWDPRLSDRYAERLANLRKLAARAKRHGIGIYLYLNEPRAMPLALFKDRPEMRGVAEGDWAALCTSDPKVRNYLADSVESICRAVPDLAGFFTITASENLTNCWSHHQGSGCPRCGPRGAEMVIAEVNSTFAEGIRRAGTGAKLLAWDWGWTDSSAPGIIARLPAESWLMSVSEWALPIERGGVKNTVGEYSISSIGPGPRAQKNWELARKRGLKTVAKVQAGCTWELSTIPYIPALENVARHAANLRSANVDGIMLGWTLGGYPSPNLEVMTSEQGNVESTLLRAAEARVGKQLGPALVRMWKECSAAFREYPYDGAVVYNAPVQIGPANLLWEKPTGYHATMVGFPYDDLDGWRGPYPPGVFAAQYQKMADGFDGAIRTARQAAPISAALESEIRIAEACAIDFRSVANQTRFVLARRALERAASCTEAEPQLMAIERILTSELSLAKRLFALQQADSRLGFEASNQYAYVPLDLAEKVIACRDLLDRWLQMVRSQWRK